MMIFMENDWRNRIRFRLKETGMSKRAVSLQAKCSPGYLHSILEDGKEPKLENMANIASALGVSLSWLFYGFDIGEQEERLLKLFSRMPEKQRQAILDLAGNEGD